MSIVRDALLTSVACTPRPAPREVPEQPACRSSRTRARRLGADAGPRRARASTDLGAGEVGRQRQAHAVAQAVDAGVAGELVHDRVRARVLPHDRVADRPAAIALPYDGGLALVGDAHRGDVGRARAGRRESRLDGLAARGPDLVGVVLDPAGTRMDLGGARAGRAPRRAPRRRTGSPACSSSPGLSPPRTPPRLASLRAARGGRQRVQCRARSPPAGYGAQP